MGAVEMTVSFFDAEVSTTKHAVELESDVFEWVLRGDDSEFVPRRKLLEQARARLDALMRIDRASEFAVDPASVGFLDGVLEFVVQDGDPTPQVVPSGDGAVQAEWLVNGKHAEVAAYPDGELVWLWEGTDGEESVSTRAGSSAIDVAKRLSRTLHSWSGLVTDRVIER